MKKFLLLIVMIVFNLPASAQDCACCTDAHRAFDFWVGEWEVYNPTGNKLGKNSIKKLEKGCIISEHWQGMKGSSGRSYNYYNPKDSTWNQIWIDSSGKHLILKGQVD